MTNYERVIYVTAAFLSQKKWYTKNRSACKNAVTWELHAPTHRLLITRTTWNDLKITLYV